MIELLALDIDDTLANSDGSVDDEVISAIEAVQHSGIQVVLASARPPEGVNDIARKLGDGIHKICSKPIENMRISLGFARFFFGLWLK